MTLLRTEIQRRIYWKTIDRLQGNSIRRASALSFAQLKEDKNKVAKAVEGSIPDAMSLAATTAIEGQAEDWLKLFRRIWRENFVFFGARVVGQFQKADIDLIDTITRERWEQLADEFVALTIADKIPNLLSNSNGTLQRVIADGIAEGKGIDAIARSIREQNSNFSKGRATRIARTEVIPASNLGSMEGARTVDPRMRKEWLSTPGPRTRATHAAIDGQIRNLDEPFDVGGFQVMFPGDTSLGAPARETINERCTLAYLPQPVREVTGIG